MFARPGPLVHASEVHWVEARGNYVHLHTADGPSLLRETLSTLATALAPQRFVRVHRSALVALREVTAIERQPSGDYELLLRGGARVPMSRTHKAEFTALWGQCR